MTEHSDPDMFDVRAAIRTVADAIRQYWKLILLTTLVTVSMVVAYTMIWPPIYRTEASLMVENDTDLARDAYYSDWNVFRKDDARTELELMTAGTVLMELIKRENLRYDDVYHPFLAHARHLWQQSRVGKVYRSTKEFFFKNDDPTPPERIELGKTLDGLAAGLKVAPVGDSHMVKMTVLGPSRRVADMANSLIRIYLEQRGERHASEAQRAYEILTTETERSGEELREFERQRLAFQRRHGLAFDFQKETQELKELTNLEAAIASNKVRIATVGASLRVIESQLAEQPATHTIATQTEVNTAREAAKGRRLELEMGLIQARGRYREDAPEVQELKRDIEKLDALIAGSSERVARASTEGINGIQQQLLTSRNSLRAEYEGLQAGLAVQEQTARELSRRLARVPVLQQQLLELDRRFGLAREKYQALVLKQAQTGVSLKTAKATMPTVKVVDWASVPGAKWWPKTKMLLPAALLGGLALGLVMAVITSHLDGRVRAAHLANGKSALPLYSTIAVAAERAPFSVMTRSAGVKG